LTCTCCCMYSLELLMMDGKPSETYRVLFQNKINLRSWCIWLVLIWKYIAMHGPMGVRIKSVSKYYNLNIKYLYEIFPILKFSIQNVRRTVLLHTSELTTRCYSSLICFFLSYFMSTVVTLCPQSLLSTPFVNPNVICFYKSLTSALPPFQLSVQLLLMI
jgi:hypothetical protein